MDDVLNLFAGWSRQDLLALGQFVAGVLALAIAVWALIAAYAQGRKSTRKVFQLYVLRDLLRLTDRGIPDYGAATARLAMLPRDFLPFWRRWAELRFALIGSAQLDSDMDKMGAPADLHIQDRYVWALREDVRRTVKRKGHRTSRLAVRTQERPNVW